MRKGDAVIRRDQPSQQGIVADVALGVLVFVCWHQRPPSYEHIRDLQAIPAQKKAPAGGRRGLRIRASAERFRVVVG